MIILSRTDANQVRGLTLRGAALAPRPFRSGSPNVNVAGKFGLPEAVLNDPAHNSHVAFLATLPTVRDENINNGTPSSVAGTFLDTGDWCSESSIVRPSTFNPDTWVPGQLISAPACTGGT